MSRAFLLISLCLLLVRGGVFWANSNSFQDDPDAYRAIATTLHRTGTFGVQFGSDTTSLDSVRATAFRPPLYPWILSWLIVDHDAVDANGLPAVRVAIFHLVLILITLLTTYSVAYQLAGERAALLACLMIGLDPILVQQSTLVMTETLAVCLAAVVIWWWVRHLVPSIDSSGTARGTKIVSCLILGALLGLAYLCRPTFLVWAGLIVVASPWSFARCRSGLMVGGLVVAVVGVTVAAWTARNVRMMGHPVWATTHGGYTLLLGNNSSFYDYLRDGFSWRSWDAEPFLEAYQDRHETMLDRSDVWGISPGSIAAISSSASEVEEDRWASDVAKATIRQQPLAFAGSSVVRVMRLWSPIPLLTPQRSLAAVVIVGSYYLVFYGLVVVAIYRQRIRMLGIAWLPLWTLVITLTLVHSIYWSNLRMRSPAIPGFAIIAATALMRRTDCPETKKGPLAG